MAKTEWPWTNMITLIKKFNKKKNQNLEIGCGSGCNIPFYLKEKKTILISLLIMIKYG